MPYGKPASKIEAELEGLTEEQYRIVRAAFEQIEDVIGSWEGDEALTEKYSKFPITAKYLDKLNRALHFLEYDHGGKFEW